MKRQKKNKLITYFLCFIPGAGFMYRYYMKRGISFLTLFLSSICIISWLEIGMLSFIPVVIWFYSFFDQINSLGANDDNSGPIQDEFLWQSLIQDKNLEKLEKQSRLAGGICLAAGNYLFVRCVSLMIISILPETWQETAYQILDYVPMMLLACGIVYLGTYLIQKKNEALNPYHKLLKKSGANVVYYMHEGKRGEGIEMDERIKEESEIIEQADREQLLRKAKQMLNDEIYQSIHIETASALEPVEVEKGNKLDRPQKLDAVIVEDAPQVESAAAIEKAQDIERVEIEQPENHF